MTWISQRGEGKVMKRTIAMILAGGRGKRMDVLCYLRPKPLLPFAGRFRVVDFSLSNCIHSQIRSIAVLVDYQRADMAEYLRRWRSANSHAEGLSVLAPGVGYYAGTADAVYRNLDYLKRQGADTVLVLAGDHVYKMDYRNMLAFHKKVKADTTVGIVHVPVEQAHRFGTVAVDTEGRIMEFVEKSSRPHSDLASMGIYVFNKDFLAVHLAEDASEAASPHDFGYSILPKMVKRDRIFAYEFNGYWQDIGTVEAYYEANMELLRAKPRLSLDGNWPISAESNALPVEPNPEVCIENSLISPGCLIKGRVENSILSPGVRIEENAVVRDSVVMAGTSIGYHSVIDKCILDEGVNVGKCCYAGFGSGLVSGNREITVLGKGVTVPDYTAIGRRCKISSRVEANAFSTGIVTSGSTVV
jgi:glucose-1-phosphate adenylyltransferase